MIHVVALRRRPVREMPRFLSVLAREQAYVRVIPNVWLVDSDRTARQLAARLRRTIRRTDTLLVIRAEDEFDGWLTESVLEWLEVSSDNGDFE